MAVKIYDSSAGAFKDAPTPQIYDASAQAYKDSTGLVYDTSKGAWDERWGDNKVLYLYNQGDECTSITGGLSKSGYSYGNKGLAAFTIYEAEKRADNLYFEAKGSGVLTCVGTQTKLDLKPYKSLNIRFTPIAVLGSLNLIVTLSDTKAVNEENCIMINRIPGEVNVEKVETIDISNVDSAYMLLATTYEKRKLKIHEVWLEK